MQRMLNEGRIGEEVTRDTLDALVEAGVVGERLTGHDFDFLQRLGVHARSDGSDLG